MPHYRRRYYDDVGYGKGKCGKRSYDNDDYYEKSQPQSTGGKKIETEIDDKLVMNPDYFGAIVGPKRRRLRALKAETACYIDVPKNDKGKRDSIIWITGYRADVEYAKKRIKEIVAEKKAQEARRNQRGTQTGRNEVNWHSPTKGAAKSAGVIPRAPSSPPAAQLPAASSGSPLPHPPTATASSRPIPSRAEGSGRPVVGRFDSPQSLPKQVNIADANKKALEAARRVLAAAGLTFPRSGKIPTTPMLARCLRQMLAAQASPLVPFMAARSDMGGGGPDDYVAVLDCLHNTYSNYIPSPLDSGFELYGGDTAARLFRAYEDLDTVEMNDDFLRYQIAVRVAFQVEEMLLSTVFIQELKDMEDEIEGNDLEIGFFADKFYVCQDGSLLETVPWVRPRNLKLPPRAAGESRVTAIFELTLNPTMTYYKLLQLEKRIAFYRAYTAALGLLKGQQHWTLVNTMPLEAGQQQILCGVVVPRHSIPNLKRLLANSTHIYDNLNLFGCEVVPSMKADLERGESGIVRVCRLTQRPNPEEGLILDGGKIVDVEIELHNVRSLRSAIKETFSVPSSAASVQVFDWRGAPLGQVIGPNTDSHPYYFFAPRYWVLAKGKLLAIELDSAPLTMTDLQFAIKKRFSLSCEFDEIIVEPRPAAVIPNTSDTAYVFHVKVDQCWVQERSEDNPTLLPGRPPGTLNGLKIAIKRFFVLPCEIDCIIIDGFQAEDADVVADVVANDVNTPYIFSVLKCWVQEKGDDNPTLLPEVPMAPDELKTAIKTLFALRCEIDCINIIGLEAGADVVANDANTPYIFSVLKCWVQEKGDDNPTLLPGRPPRTLTGLKSAIKRFFVLPCEIDSISIVGPQTDADVIANNVKSPYVFFVLKCWVQETRDGTPTLLPGMPPRNLNGLKLAIRRFFFLPCEIDRISIDGLQADSPVIANDFQTPYCFSVQRQE